MAIIYKISRIDTDQCYVGHTVEQPRRWWEHRNLLRGRKHHSPYLQSAWNKYGEDAFLFEVVEECLDEDKVVREQYWIDNLNSCFNSAPAAGSILGYRFTDEQRARCGIHRIGVKETPEQTESRLAASREGMLASPNVWITNGVKNVRHPIAKSVPDGWYQSRTFSEEHKAATLAASSGPRSEDVRASIKAGHANTWDDPEKRKRMLENRRPFSWWTDGTTNKRVPLDEMPPEGWVSGFTRDPSWNKGGRPHVVKPPKVEHAPKPVIEKPADRRPDAARALLANGEASRRGSMAWDNPESRAVLTASRADQCWITNGTENKRQSKSEPIPDGWRQGRGGLFGRAAAKAQRAQQSEELPF
jgi:group I intron endonuclease